MLNHPHAGPADRCVLTPPQRQAVDLLANGATVVAAAEAMSINRNTIFHWRRLPHFQTALAAAVAERAALRRRQFEALVPAAIETLSAALTGPATSPATRVKTALAILDRAGVRLAPELVDTAKIHVTMSSQAETAPKTHNSAQPEAETHGTKPILLISGASPQEPDPPNPAQPQPEIERTNPILPLRHTPNSPNSAQAAAKTHETKPILTAPENRSAASPALSPISDPARGLRLASPALSPICTPKVGRNEPCPCGSGRKYKKCCLP